MKITDIKECGASNILHWAISNGADIKGDNSLQSIINTETYYQIRVEDVNFLELFRLTQTYREKVHVILEHQSELPETSVLSNIFKGEIEMDGTKVSLSEAVEHCSNLFINLALQMNADNDIIRPGVARLFLPMISRRFDIDIPLSFMDFIKIFDTKEDLSLVFNNNYPNNINDILLGPGSESDDPASLKERYRYLFLHSYLLQGTNLIRYSEHLEKLIKLVKYAPLRKCVNNKLYKYRLLSFSKYNVLNRNEVRCSMFNINKVELEEKINQINTIKSPLKADFVIQLPIQYMYILENTYTPEELSISFESSITSILESGLSFNDFISPEFEESEDEKIKEYENAVSVYKNRIDEVNNTLLGTIPLLIQNSDNVNLTDVFSLMPTIYTSKAVVTLNLEYENRYLTHFDPLLKELLTEMVNAMKGIK